MGSIFLAAVFAQPPVLSIQSGAAGSATQSAFNLTTRKPAIALQGSAVGAGGILRVTWESLFGIGGQAAVERDSRRGRLAVTWKTPPIPLHPGPNRIKIRATDLSGRVAISSLVVDRLADLTSEPAPEIRTGLYRGRRVTYHVVRGRAIYQGDIILSASAELEQRRAGLPSARSRTTLAGEPSPRSATIADSSELWLPVNGVVQVPYLLSSDTKHSATADQINAAIASFNTTFSGLIQWVPFNSQPDYVFFDLTPGDQSGACASNVGRTGGQQVITGSVACVESTFLHEMGHAIGLWHEQSRLDRDTYVNVLYGNIDKPLASNFDKELSNEIDLGLYDFGSLMHYNPFGFSKYGIAPTLESIPSGIPLGNSQGYSSGDIDAIRRLYGAAPTAVTIDSNPSGATVIVDGTSVTTPQTFNWSLNSSHTLNLPSDPQAIGGEQNIFGRWNDSAGATRSHTIIITPGNGTELSPEISPAHTVYVANFIPIYPYSLYAGTSYGTASVTPTPSLTFGGSNYFLNRQLVTLQATPDAGFGFSQWFGVALFSLTANPNTFYVENNLSNVQPSFIPSPVLTVTSDAPDFPSTFLFRSIEVLIDGSATFTPDNLSWTTAHSLDGTPQNPSPVTTNISYAFANWSDGGAAQHSVTPPLDSSNQTITANYTPSWRAIVNPSPFCGGTASPADQMIPNGTNVNFSASPSPGFAFVGWGGDLSGSSNPLSQAVNDEVLATANFNVTGTAAPVTIGSISPASISAESGAVDLTVNGTGFTSATNAFWGFNDSFRNSTFVNSTQIIVHLNAGDVATAGYSQLKLANTANGCPAYDVATYAITSAANVPALAITKSHAGNFAQGQQGATYSVTVSNAVGAATTSGTVTVTEMVPSGLTLTSMSGSGWTCPGTAANNCTRTDPLVGGGAYAAITVTVNVGFDAPVSVTNSVTVSSPGAVSATANDFTTINANPPALSIAKSHSGNFTQGQQGAQYTVTVSNNSGAGPTTGTVTVTDNVPPGLTLALMSGSGWNCSSNTCSRSNSLSGGSSYPPITVTVNVAANAPSQVTNQVSLSGGGSANANGSDTTIINASSAFSANAGVFLYDPLSGNFYSGLSSGTGTFNYIYMPATPAFDILRDGDVNGDGKTDLIFYNSSSSLGYTLLGNGDGTYKAVSLFWGPGFKTVSAGDLNGDGKTDFLIYRSTDGTSYTALSNGDGTFHYKYTLVSAGFTHMAVADFNGDGRADVFYYNSGTGAAYLGISDGVGGFGFSPVALQAGYNFVETGDINADGKADLVVYSAAPGIAKIGLSGGAGFRFTANSWSPGFTTVKVFDFNGDGKADIVLYNRNNTLGYLLAGDGTGNFTAHSLFWGQGYDNIQTLDLNGDGKQDVIIYNSANGASYTGISSGVSTTNPFTYRYAYWGMGRMLATTLAQP